MNYQINSSQKNFQSLLTPEQFNQIIAAITEGRYSWACVLILRFIGYNPLHFIPQRTYSRLVKENAPLSANTKTSASINSTITSSHNRTTSPVMSQVDDLDYLETSDKKQVSLQGKSVPLYLEQKMATLYPSKSARRN